MKHPFSVDDIEYASCYGGVMFDDVEVAAKLLWKRLVDRKAVLTLTEFSEAKVFGPAYIIKLPEDKP
jgi:hypothetical protein